MDITWFTFGVLLGFTQFYLNIFSLYGMTIRVSLTGTVSLFLWNGNGSWIAVQVRCSFVFVCLFVFSDGAGHVRLDAGVGGEDPAADERLRLRHVRLQVRRLLDAPGGHHLHAKGHALLPPAHGLRDHHAAAARAVMTGSARRRRLAQRAVSAQRPWSSFVFFCFFFAPELNHLLINGHVLFRRAFLPIYAACSPHHHLVNFVKKKPRPIKKQIITEMASYFALRKVD